MKKLGKKYNAMENSVMAYVCFCECYPTCWYYGQSGVTRGASVAPNSEVTSRMSSTIIG